MTVLSGLLLAGAVVAAVLDWRAVAQQERLLEYLFKPLTLLLLFGVACTLDSPDNAMQTWFAVALFFSLVGDIFLMLERDLFVVGLGAFFVAHLAYIGGFLAGEVGGVGLAIGLIVVAAAVGLIGMRIVRSAISSEPDLAVPVKAYMAVISAMLIVAFGSGQPLAVVGALLFYASDAMIGWNRFVRPDPMLPLAIIVTYHLGQIGLTLSLI